MVDLTDSTHLQDWFSCLNIWNNSIGTELPSVVDLVIPIFSAERFAGNGSNQESHFNTFNNIIGSACYKRSTLVGFGF